MVGVAQMSSPEWFTVVAAITDAQHLGELESAALNALKERCRGIRCRCDG